MPAHIIQTMTFTQIMVTWTPRRSVEDHLKDLFQPDTAQVLCIITAEVLVLGLQVKLTFYCVFQTAFIINGHHY